MKILSVFITSNSVYLSLHINGVVRNENFSYYPFFQETADLEYLINSYLASLNQKIDDFLVIPISTIFDLRVFGKKTNFLSYELNKKNDFLYIYLDNQSLYSNKNISLSSLGLSNRSDNFISNRSVFSVDKFTGDAEEIIYLSKSLTETYNSFSRVVVFGGDYFTNPQIPNEYKLNLVSEVLNSGFYEVYIDNKNEYPNFLNLRNNTSLGLKFVDFEKFCYLISSEKIVEILVEKDQNQKFLNLSLNETFFLHFNHEKELKLKLKGRGIKNEELVLDTEFSGIFVDLRAYKNKKENLGLESFRKVLNSIQKENDFTSL